METFSSPVIQQKPTDMILPPKDTPLAVRTATVTLSFQPSLPRSVPWTGSICGRVPVTPVARREKAATITTAPASGRFPANRTRPGCPSGLMTKRPRTSRTRLPPLRGTCPMPSPFRAIESIFARSTTCSSLCFPCWSWGLVCALYREVQSCSSTREW